jgi:flagellar biosynthesis/type III secretory pathway protein FliH
VGKIYKEARFADARYVVHVPRADAPHEAYVGDDEDDRLASYLAQPSHANGLALELPPPPPAQPAVPQIDTERLRADAEAIVDNAAAAAEQLILQAESAARDIVAKAEQHGAELAETARANGHTEGYEAGSEAARAELAPAIATMRELIVAIETERGAAIMAAEPELVRLAVEIAERVVHTELQTNQNVIVENVRQALTRLVSREVVTLRVNPVDLDAIRAHRDEIVSAGDVEHLRIVEDQRVDRGGVMVETDAGTIDAKIATQLREARRAILAEDDDGIALGDAEVLAPPAQAS